MSYATLAQLHARLAPTPPLSDVSQDDLLQLALDWATEWIDQQTNRFFVARTESHRLFAEWHDPYLGYQTSNPYASYGDPYATYGGRSKWRDPFDPRLLSLDQDILSVTNLVNGDGTVIPADQFWLEPFDEAAKYQIRLSRNYIWIWGQLDAYVQIDGDWGYSATPPALIVGTCLRLAEWHFRSKAPSDSTTMFDASYSTKMPPGFPLEVASTVRRFERLAR